jgi:hypothetical protein
MDQRKVEVMSAWLCIPSARPLKSARPVIQAWLAEGYNVALWREREFGQADWHIPIDRGMVLTKFDEPYPGYANATNFLISLVRLADKGADWFVIGGDDVYPDPLRPAEEIARECSTYFSGTYGVMQPTGDRWGEDGRNGAYIDRICGSAWIGRGFSERIYGGKGPLWHEYRHMFVDEELQNVAIREGMLWQRRDLTQHHDHALRRGRREELPEHLREWYSSEHWNESRALFQRRKAAGFPAHEVKA